MTRRLWATILGVVVLAACSNAAAVGWRDLALTLPDGWGIVEDRATVLTLTDAPVGPTPGDPGAQQVLAQFQVVEGTAPGPWRDLVIGAGGVLEEDRPVELDGAAGTRLTWLWTTNGIRTREMILVIPSRRLEILFQPIALAGQADAAEVFVRHRDEFEAIIASLSFGAPVE